MASPQTEKGYTRLANELAQALYRFSFNGPELRVILWVLRASFGWSRRDTPATSVRMMAKDMDAAKASVGRALKGLCERGVVLRLLAGGFRLNKNYDEWLPRGAGQLKLLANTAAKRAAQSDAPKPPKKRPRAGAEPTAFTPPTLTQVQEYCRARKNGVDPERFWNHYDANGWVMGRNQMSNWKSAVCYWERTSYGRAPAPTGKPCPLCDGPLPYPNAIVCEGCKAYCRACGAQTARLKIVARRDGTKTAQCAGGCAQADPGPAAAATPDAAKFMAEHRRKMLAKERP